MSTKHQGKIIAALSKLKPQNTDFGESGTRANIGIAHNYTGIAYRYAYLCAIDLGQSVEKIARYAGRAIGSFTDARNIFRDSIPALNVHAMVSDMNRLIMEKEFAEWSVRRDDARKFKAEIIKACNLPEANDMAEYIKLIRGGFS